MADYHPLIARAVGALERDNAENRRALYERARSALVSQLRGTMPPLQEAEITRERLALEEAIRRVEVESARRAREAPKDTSKEAPTSPTRMPPPRPVPPEPVFPARVSEPIRRPEPPTPFASAFVRSEIVSETPAPPSPPPPSEIVAPREPPPSPSPEIVVSPVPPVEVAVPSVLPSEPLPIPPSLAIDEPPAKSAAPQIAPMNDAGPRERESKFDEALKKIRDVAGSLRRPAADAPARQPRPIIAPVAAPGPRMVPFGDEPVFPVAPAEPAPSIEPSVPEVSPVAEADALGDAEAIQVPKTEPDAPAQETELFRPQRRRGRDDAVVRKPPPTASTDADSESLPGFRKLPALHSYRRVLWLGILLVVVLGAGALAYWQGPALVKATRDMVASMRSTSPPALKETAPTRQKNTDRIGQSDSVRSARDGTATQRAMLTTEDANSASGRDYVGTAKWRVETTAPSPGRPSEVVLKLDVDIPDRGFAMAWTIKRNTDPQLPATHTIDIEFTIAENSPLGSIAEIKSLLMKKPTETEGKPLWGHAQKSTPNYFLVGLSATPADAQYNLALLKEQPAFDMALVFTKARRAFLLIEKGPVGERAFADAFAAWKQ